MVFTTSESSPLIGSAVGGAVGKVGDDHFDLATLFSLESLPDLMALPMADLQDEDSLPASLQNTPYSVTPANFFPSSTSTATPLDSPDQLEASPMFESVGNPNDWDPLFGDFGFESSAPPTIFSKPQHDVPAASSLSLQASPMMSALPVATPMLPPAAPSTQASPLVKGKGVGKPSPLRVAQSSPSLTPETPLSELDSPDAMIISADGLAVSISERKRKRVTPQSYTRRPRSEPLPPIVVNDAEDPVLVKRARNTLAARRSRERKTLRLSDLEKQVDELQVERDDTAAKLEAALERIKCLEAEVSLLRG
ncbi:uncharacterized protein V1510DRAFT_418900 [Dipodascopsis tothii]|uniref:uncharacterized protein n=1 Tax=Dipodascopsis tothii TaxID=44089 RepID=UPI0034CD31CF